MSTNAQGMPQMSGTQMPKNQNLMPGMQNPNNQLRMPVQGNLNAGNNMNSVNMNAANIGNANMNMNNANMNNPNMNQVVRVLVPPNQQQQQPQNSNQIMPNPMLMSPDALIGVSGGGGGNNNTQNSQVSQLANTLGLNEPGVNSNVPMQQQLANSKQNQQQQQQQAGQSQNQPQISNIPQNMQNMQNIQVLFGSMDPNGPGASLSALGALPMNSQVQASNVPGTKDWRNLMPSDYRYHVVYTFVTAMLPVLNLKIMLNIQIYADVAYAKKVECDMYKNASSNWEYYILVLKKIDEIQKEFEGKRQMQQAQMAQSQAGTTTWYQNADTVNANNQPMMNAMGPQRMALQGNRMAVSQSGMMNSGMQPQPPQQPQTLSQPQQQNQQVMMNNDQQMMVNAQQGNQQQQPQGAGVPSGPQQRPQPQQPNQNMPGQLQTDPEKRKRSQQQLVLLLHAHKCQKRENDNPNGQDATKCTLPHCKTMKEVLNHMTNCKTNKDCTVPHCSSSRQILSHWKNCNRADCPVCSPLKQANKGNNSNAQGNIGTTNAPTMNVQSNVNTTSNAPTSIPNLITPNQQNPGNQQGDGLNIPLTVNDPNGPVASSSALGPLPMDSQVQASNVPGTKDWHNSITSDLRNLSVQKLVQSIFPTPDPAAMLDNRMPNLFTFAKKVEGYMYEMANSRKEYDHLLAEKINENKKKLEEKQQKRKEQQMQQAQMAQSQAGTTSATATAPQQTNPMQAGIQANQQQQIRPNRQGGMSQMQNVSPLVPQQPTSQSQMPNLDSIMQQSTAEINQPNVPNSGIVSVLQRGNVNNVMQLQQQMHQRSNMPMQPSPMMSQPTTLQNQMQIDSNIQQNAGNVNQSNVPVQNEDGMVNALQRGNPQQMQQQMANMLSQPNQQQQQQQQQQDQNQQMIQQTQMPPNQQVNSNQQNSMQQQPPTPNSQNQSQNTPQAVTPQHTPNQQNQMIATLQPSSLPQQSPSPKPGPSNNMSNGLFNPEELQKALMPTWEKIYVPVNALQTAS